MADQPVERIYAEVGIKSTLTSDLAGVTQGLSSAEEMITSFSTSVTAAGTLVSTAFDTALYTISSFAETSRVSFEKVKESLAGVSTQVKKTAEEFTISIKEMMSAAASFRGVQDLTKGFASGEQETIARFKEVSKLMGLNLPEAAGKAKNALSELGTVTARTRNVMDLFASTIAAVPAIIIGKFEGLGVKVAAEFEVVSLQLERFYGDLETATDRFQKFSSIAAKTPFQFDEIMRSVLMMKDIGIQADAYINTLMDTSSAMNRSLDESTRTFVAAIGGRFQMLRNYGIYAYQVTQTNMDKISELAGREVEVGDTALLYYDMQGRQKVSTVNKYNKEMIASTLEAIWNEKFSGAMEKFSQTVTGLWSTVQDTFKYGAAEIVGYSMEDMSIRTVSLISVLKLLEQGLISALNVWNSLPGPIQTFASVVLTSVAAISLLVTAMGVLEFILPAIVAGLKAVNVMFGVTAVTAEAATGAVTELGAAAVFTETVTGILPLIVALGALVAALDLAQEKFGILNPAIEAFHNLSTVIVFDVPILAQEFEDWVNDGLQPAIDYVEELNKKLDGLIDKFPDLQNVVDAFKESLLGITGLKIFDFLYDGINWIADTQRDRAKEIEDIEKIKAAAAEESSQKTIKAYDETGERYGDFRDGIDENSDGVIDDYENVGDAAESSSKRQIKAIEDAYDKYVETNNLIRGLQESGLVTEDNPNEDKDIKKLNSIDDKLVDEQEKIKDSQDKLDDLNKEYEKTLSENTKTLSKLQEDIDEQIKEVDKLTKAGIDNNPQVLKMQKDLAKEKKNLQDLYSDDSIEKAKEKLAELYSTEDIDKEKRRLEKLYSDTSIQKAKERLSELMSTEAIDDAKERLQEIYEDDSVEEAKEKLAELYSDDSIAEEEAKLQELYSTKDIEEAKEKLAELYSTDEIDKEIKQLQELYSDNSIEKEKEKLAELYSTEAIDKEKQKLLDLFNDDSIQEAKEKLWELQSDTGDIDSEREKLLDLQKDLLNNKEYALASKQTIEQEITALETLYSKLSDETATQNFEDVTDPLIREMLQLRDAGSESDKGGIKEQIQEKLKELRLELAQLNPDSNAYTSELVAQLDEYTKEAEELKQKAEADPTADNIEAYMSLQEKILDLQKEIADSKNNPNVDPVTELQNQIKEQQDRIGELEEQRAKEIQEQQEKIIELERQRADDIKAQQEKIAQLEKERVDDIKDQQEKIAQMEIDHAEDIKEQEDRITEMKADREKSIREQQEKIVELQKEHEKSIAEQEKKIAEMKADREKDIADQQEKIAKLEEERAKNVKEQQEKILKLEAERSKDIKEQQDKIAQMELERAEDILEQQKKIAKMEEDRVKDIAEQQKKITKLEEDLAQEKIDTQDRITELENDIITKKQELNDNLIEAQKKLDEARENYQNTILDQSANVTDLQGQITDQNSLIFKLQGEIEQLKTDKLELERKIGSLVGTDDETLSKLISSEGIDLKPQASLPAGTDFRLVADPITKEVFLKYIDLAKNQKSISLHDLGLPNGTELEGVNGSFVIIDESIKRTSSEISLLEQHYYNAGIGIISVNNEISNSHEEYKQKVVETRKIWGEYTNDLTDTSKISMAPLAEGMVMVNTATEKNVPMVRDVNTWFDKLNQMSFTELLKQITLLYDQHKITGTEAATLYSYLCQVKGVSYEESGTSVEEFRKHLNDADVEAISTHQHLTDINTAKLDQAKDEIWGVDAGLKSSNESVRNTKTGMDSLNNETNLGNVDREINAAKTDLGGFTDETKLSKSGVLDIDALSVPNIRRWIQWLTEDEEKGTKESDKWNTSITDKDGLKFTNIDEESDTLTGKQKEGTKKSDDWNKSIAYTDTLKTTNITDEVKTTGKELDSSKGKTDLFSGALSILDGLSLSSITSEVDLISTAIDTGKKKLEEFLNAVANYVPGARSLINTYLSDLEKAWNQYVAPIYTAKAPPSSSSNNKSVNNVRQSNNTTTVNNVKIGTQNNNGATLQTKNIQQVYW